MTSRASTSATSSPGSVSGLTPCGAPDGPTTGLSGPEAAPASPSRSRARALASKTLATSGPTGFGSLPSAGLTRSLVSRLQAHSHGSILYRLTWKLRATPSQRLIYALRASPARISASGFIGWPTPTTPSGGQTWPEGTSATGRRPDGSKATVNLEQVSMLAGRNTPTAVDRVRNEETMAKCLAFRNSNGQNSVPLYLGEEAMLAGWATAQAKDGSKSPSRGAQQRGGFQSDLPLMARSADATGFSVETAKSGLLRPGHSRWLQRLPVEWDYCGATAMAWTRKRR